MINHLKVSLSFVQNMGIIFAGPSSGIWENFGSWENIGITPQEPPNTDILIANIKMNEMEYCFETILQFKNKELLAPDSYELSVLNEFNNISKRTLHY